MIWFGLLINTHNFAINSNQLRKLLFLVCLLPLFTLGQNFVSGYITDKNNSPIPGAMVFFQQAADLNTTSDDKGFFKIDYSGYDISGFRLVVFKDGYKEKTFPGKKLKDLMVITLDPVKEIIIKTDSTVIYENDIVELSESVFYSSFVIDSIQKINSILDNIKKNHAKNYPSINTTYEVNGYHALTEQASPEKEDTLLYLKSPLHLELTSYSDNSIHLNSHIAVQPASVLYVRNNEYNVSRESPFFLYEQFSWIDFISKDFLNKRKLYKYEILYEDDDVYELAFRIKKIQEDSWSGVMTVNKKDFAILKLEVNLGFNRKNSYTIVSKNQTKNATSIIYFEGAKIVWEFGKSEYGAYKIKKLDSDYRIIHVGVNPEFTPQFLVKTSFDFKTGAVPEKCKILPLNDLLFIAFQKNYANFKN